MSNPLGVKYASCMRHDRSSVIGTVPHKHFKITVQKSFNMMSENITKTRTKMNKQQVQQENENTREELESITVVYLGKEHKIEFPNNADAKLICQCIKRETGVRGSFYVHFGEQSNNYLHCSSVTRGNLAKLAGKSLEVRGGNGKDVRTCLKN